MYVDGNLEQFGNAEKKTKSNVSKHAF